jgi:hypothetical protein
MLVFRASASALQGGESIMKVTYVIGSDANASVTIDPGGTDDYEIVNIPPGVASVTVRVTSKPCPQTGGGSPPTSPGGLHGGSRPTSPSDVVARIVESTHLTRSDVAANVAGGMQGLGSLHDPARQFLLEMYHPEGTVAIPYTAVLPDLAELTGRGTYRFVVEVDEGSIFPEAGGCVLGLTFPVGLPGM